MTVKEQMKFQSQSFKDQGAVLAFAAKHPGALSAFFLAMVHQRMSQGLVRRTSDLRSQSLVQWAQSHAGLTETRDQREVLTLAMAMDNINNKQLSSAMDILSQRIQAIQVAKGKSGSWDKAAKIELVVQHQSTAASSGLLRLTQ